jgi:hypothetical protein
MKLEDIGQEQIRARENMSNLLDEVEQVKSKTRIEKGELTIFILNQKKTTEADNLVRLKGKAKAYGKRTDGL